MKQTSETKADNMNEKIQILTELNQIIDGLTASDLDLDYSNFELLKATVQDWAAGNIDENIAINFVKRVTKIQ